MRPKESLEDGFKPEEADTSEFHSHSHRLHTELETSCKKFQLTEL